MPEQDMTSYEVSTFTIDVSRLSFYDNGLVVKEDFPAYLHEWWHYIQDISTITGQNGFYLWFRDLARMSHLTCSGSGQKIIIPLGKDEYDEVYSKYRQLYNIYCGAKENKRIDGAHITAEPVIQPNHISFDGEKHAFGKCTLQINGINYNFGALALEELNAYYAQKIAESFLPGITFNSPADSLPEFPYKVGDLLFEYYNVDCDSSTRLILSYIALDTLQAPIVFIRMLDALKNRHINYSTDEKEIEILFRNVVSASCHPNDEAYGEWANDYSNWLKNDTKQSLRDALHWYLVLLGMVDDLKSQCGIEIFPKILSQSLENFNLLHAIFTTPLLKRDEVLYGMKVGTDDKRLKFSQEDYDNAMILWTHRRIYNLLKSRTKEEANENSKCPLYNNGKCVYISNYNTDKGYDCLTAPWMVVKNERQALCPYAVAAHSMGLWQNDLYLDV